MFLKNNKKRKCEAKCVDINSRQFIQIISFNKPNCFISFSSPPQVVIATRLKANSLEKYKPTMKPNVLAVLLLVTVSAVTVQGHLCAVFGFPISKCSGTQCCARQFFGLIGICESLPGAGAPCIRCSKYKCSECASGLTCVLNKCSSTPTQPTMSPITTSAP